MAHLETAAEQADVGLDEIQPDALRSTELRKVVSCPVRDEERRPLPSRSAAGGARTQSAQSSRGLSSRLFGF